MRCSVARRSMPLDAVSGNASGELLHLEALLRERAPAAQVRASMDGILSAQGDAAAVLQLCMRHAGCDTTALTEEQVGALHASLCDHLPVEGQACVAEQALRQRFSEVFVEERSDAFAALPNCLRYAREVGEEAAELLRLQRDRLMLVACTGQSRPVRLDGIVGSDYLVVNAAYLPAFLDTEAEELRHRYVQLRLLHTTDPSGAIGRGATAVVHRGYDLGKGYEVAIKGCNSRAEHVCATLLREAEQLRQLGDHPNCVALYDTVCVRDEGRKGGVPALVLEWCGGGTLRTLLMMRGEQTAQTLPVGRGYFFRDTNVVGMISHKLSDGLKYMHDKKVAHRDLKLDNIFIKDNCDDLRDVEPKIGDFGFARKSGGPGLPVRRVGTTRWLAPEVCTMRQDDVLDERKVDVWALGLVTWCAASGFLPFGLSASADVELDFVAQAAKSPLRFPRVLRRPELRPFRDLLAAMLQPNPAERLAAADVVGNPWLRDSARRSRAVDDAGGDGDSDFEVVDLGCGSLAFDADLLSHVASFLAPPTHGDAGDWDVLRRVCKRFFFLWYHPGLWREYFTAHYGRVPKGLADVAGPGSFSAPLFGWQMFKLAGRVSTCVLCRARFSFKDSSPCHAHFGQTFWMQPPSWSQQTWSSLVGLDYILPALGVGHGHARGDCCGALSHLPCETPHEHVAEVPQHACQTGAAGALAHAVASVSWLGAVQGCRFVEGVGATILDRGQRPISKLMLALTGKQVDMRTAWTAWAGAVDSVCDSLPRRVVISAAPAPAAAGERGHLLTP
eukprot:TRINITY_DN4656_c0_g1_i3.p1 TRINITY_DN4656_c0_g1~~TRINITY_DN4656_c0_g1_i3.p1  ORF type:complete len:786 (+),score=173.53 TRINITY_DN4656_c0_g1_i3:37-2394(+)